MSVLLGHGRILIARDGAIHSRLSLRSLGNLGSLGCVWEHALLSSAFSMEMQPPLCVSTSVAIVAGTLNTRVVEGPITKQPYLSFPGSFISHPVEVSLLPPGWKLRETPEF